jgi:hypothetical protein
MSHHFNQAGRCRLQSGLDLGIFILVFIAFSFTIFTALGAALKLIRHPAGTGVRHRGLIVGLVESDLPGWPSVTVIGKHRKVHQSVIEDLSDNCGLRRVTGVFVEMDVASYGRLDHSGVSF